MAIEKNVQGGAEQTEGRAGEANAFAKTVSSLFAGMDGILASKTVVGEPIETPEGTIIPLMELSFGLGAGTNHSRSKGQAKMGGGLGGKLTPTALLVLHKGQSRIVHLRNTNQLAQIIDMVPDIMGRLGLAPNLQARDQQARKAAKEAGVEARSITPEAEGEE